MLNLLKGEGDFDVLACEEGYEARLGKDLRRQRRKVLRAYLQELLKDFDDLRRAASVAILRTGNRALAAKLLQTEKSLKRAARYMKLRLFMDHLIPAPRPRSGKPDCLRRLYVGAVGRETSVNELISLMEEVRRQTTGSTP